jgi:integral membrane protein (TIGR00529 family)
MDTLTSAPALLKIACVFALVLVLNRVRVALSLSLLAGSFVLGFWMKLSPLQVGQSVFLNLTRLQTVSLILVVGFILVISRLMKACGHLDRIVDTFGKLSRDDRIAGAVMPALIGLLPMPGGALFSASMVDAAFCRNHLKAEAKTAVNYWFRHIWEYWWPLYPGVVLAVALLETELWRFMLVMAPMTIITALAGAVFILRPLGKMSAHSGAGISLAEIRDFFWETMPILVIVIVIAALAGLTSLAGLAGYAIEVPGTLSILPGLTVSLVWVCVVNHLSIPRIQSAVLDKSTLPMLWLIAAIMIFKGIMEDSQAVIQVRDELLNCGIPIGLIIALIPFISGFITGIAVGFVGISFPLIIPLFEVSSPYAYLSYAALAYTFGYMGQILSPIHLCFLVTKDYFKAELLGSYRYILMPSLAVMAVAVLIFWVSGNV